MVFIIQLRFWIRSCVVVHDWYRSLYPIVHFRRKITWKMIFQTSSIPSCSPLCSTFAEYVALLSEISVRWPGYGSSYVFDKQKDCPFPGIWYLVQFSIPLLSGASRYCLWILLSNPHVSTPDSDMRSRNNQIVESVGLIPCLGFSQKERRMPNPMSIFWFILPNFSAYQCDRVLMYAGLWLPRASRSWYLEKLHAEPTYSTLGSDASIVRI